MVEEIRGICFMHAQNSILASLSELAISRQPMWRPSPAAAHVADWRTTEPCANKAAPPESRGSGMPPRHHQLYV